MSNCIAGEWKIHLVNSKKTCHIDIPFNSSPTVNIIMVVEHAKSLDNCRNAVSEHPDSNFFFWSLNDNPLGRNGTSNCYSFKTCSKTDSTTLIFPGNTYQRCHNQHLARMMEWCSTSN